MVDAVAVEVSRWVGSHGVTWVWCGRCRVTIVGGVAAAVPLLAAARAGGGPGVAAELARLRGGLAAEHARRGAAAGNLDVVWAGAGQGSGGRRGGGLAVPSACWARGRDRTGRGAGRCG